MRYDPDRHHRRSIRLKGRDYVRPGAYFVTMVTHDRACFFGDVRDGAMHLNAWGIIAERCWREIPQHFPRVRLDAFVIMPNHIHGIIVIVDVGATHASPQPGPRPSSTVVGATHALPQPASPQRASQPPSKEALPKGPASGSLGAIVGSFKAAVAREVNRERGAPGIPLWQRNYYEHIIRDESAGGEEEWRRARAYVRANPSHWATDAEYPHPVTGEQAP